MPTLAHLLPLVLRALGIGAEVVALLLIPFVLIRKKEPSSTIAWILTLVFLPGFGVLLFLAFGRDRVRAPARRKRAINAALHTRLSSAGVRDEAPAEDALRASGANPLEQSLFRAGAALTHSTMTAGNRVTVLSNGNVAYAAIGDAIDGAKRHVHAEYYLIRNDATGVFFRDRLVAAAKRGVEVRLLCDGYGCLAVGSRWMRPLTQAGGHVARFLPLGSVFVEPVNLRDHRKIVVVDGEVGFTGGLNVGDEYRGQMRGIGVWRDLHLRIEGAAASELQRIFLSDWAFAAREAVNEIEYVPATLPARGDAVVAVIPSGPDTQNEAIHRLFFGAIAGAREQVIVVTPYFVPDESVLVALEFAAMRGVDVKVLLPGHSNHLVTFHAGRSFYERLLEAGVRIFEYLPGMIHAKLLLADRRVCLVGSANMDLRSFRLNFEVHTLIHDPVLAATLEAYFLEDLGKSAPVMLDAWRARPWSVRVKEGASRLVSPLL